MSKELREYCKNQLGGLKKIEQNLASKMTIAMPGRFSDATKLIWAHDEIVSSVSTLAYIRSSLSGRGSLLKQLGGDVPDTTDNQFCGLTPSVTSLDGMVAVASFAADAMSAFVNVYKQNLVLQKEIKQVEKDPSAAKNKMMQSYGVLFYLLYEFMQKCAGDEKTAGKFFNAGFNKPIAQESYRKINVYQWCAT